jgi:hypothetical protein
LINAVTYVSSTLTLDYSHISMIFLGDLTLNLWDQYSKPRGEL